MNNASSIVLRLTILQSTIQSLIQRELAINHGISTNDRRTALHVARSLQSQLFFYEVEWGGRVLQDGVEDVYMFLDDNEGNGEREELPTGVVTMLTRCYSASCADGVPCYAYACPRKVRLLAVLHLAHDLTLSRVILSLPLQLLPRLQLQLRRYGLKRLKTLSSARCPKAK